MPVTGWFEGLTTRQVEVGAADYLRRRRGFVVEWWGLVDTKSGDHDLAHSIELGDRAADDAARENAPDPKDREDWLVAKALDAQPTLFADLLSLAG